MFIVDKETQKKRLAICKKDCLIMIRVHFASVC